jgi:hypothetical protein
MDFSIRHGVDELFEQYCMKIHTWFKGIFHSDRDNDNEDNEESLPLL